MTSFTLTRQQRIHEDVLHELTGARIALGAALEANYKSGKRGRPAPCDEHAVRALAAGVLAALDAARDQGVQVDVYSAMTFHASDGTRLPLPDETLTQPA